MRKRLGSVAPSAWPRLPGRTARMRLTLLYAGLFLLLGTVLLTGTYLLTRGAATIHVRAVRISNAPGQLQVQPAGSAGALSSPLSAVPPSQSLVNNGAVAQHNSDLGALLTVSWIVLALTTLGAAGLGWIAAGRVLAPLRAMASTARTISAGNLHERLALTGPDDEFKQLGDTLDELLERLQTSFEAQRRFVANASHELRTPLTLERTLTQVALADPNATAQKLRETCEELLASQSEHARLLEALLTLASSERGLDQREAVELSALIEPELTHLGPEIRRLKLSVQAQLHPAPTTGDPALIRRLMANLIDNAVAHNVTGGEVTIRTASDAGRALVSVSNTGATILPDQIERLFEPFHRLGTGRVEDSGHFGLGLSIVRAIAAAHDADITTRALSGGGLEVTVGFPAAPADPSAPS